MAVITTDSDYPHILQVMQGAAWVDISKCQDQPNTKGQTTTIANRTDFIFSSMVFIPVSDIIIKPGQPIRVLGVNRELRLDLPAARFSKDEMNFRLWV